MQKPGRYIGNELNSVHKSLPVDVRFAFCFPDSYEVGMSHLGMKILYSLLNNEETIWCERCFAPSPDMDEVLKSEGLPLCSLESKTPLSDFDFIGFTLQYELCYTNILNMLALSGLPFYSRDRYDNAPIIIGGGPCVSNAEPLADFFDMFVLGEGEEVTLEITSLYRQQKKNGYNKTAFLQAAAKIEGVYVPSLYSIEYGETGIIKAIIPQGGAPFPVKKRIIKDIDNVFYPDKFVLPFIDVVHDRVMQEVFRGCIHGCRFCQAGFLYRPVREKSAGTVNRQAKALCESTGYDEISLTSLSTADYNELPQLIEELTEWTNGDMINLSLPSLRIDSVDEALLKKIKTVRTSGLTFAPEAGTQRLRDVINKNLTEEEILNTCAAAFRGGYTSVKLYFMIGLPTETMEDIDGIAALAQAVVDAYYNNPDKPKGKSVSVSVSVSTFIPKPHTPFQWVAQDSADMIKEKQHRLIDTVRSKKIRLSWGDPYQSLLEAAFARGDRRLSAVLVEAYKSGCVFDGWFESFRPEKWREAFKTCGVSEEFYGARERSLDEILPWSHMDYGVNEEFFKRELVVAISEKTTPNCREKCSGCGITSLCGGLCNEKD